MTTATRINLTTVDLNTTDAKGRKMARAYFATATDGGFYAWVRPQRDGKDFGPGTLNLFLTLDAAMSYLNAKMNK